MILFISEAEETGPRGTPHAVAARVEPLTTINDIKAIVSSEMAIHPKLQTLFYRGEELEDVRAVLGYNIQNEATLLLVVKDYKEQYIKILF